MGERAEEVVSEAVEMVHVVTAAVEAVATQRGRWGGGGASSARVVHGREDEGEQHEVDPVCGASKAAARPTERVRWWQRV